MSKVDEFTDVLQQWQGLERQAMNDTTEIMERTQSPLIRIVMEIIRHDSLMHHRVQQFLIDSVIKESPAVTREEIAEIWDKVQAHDKLEKKTVAMGEHLREKAWSPVHRTLLDYLVRDEAKHDTILGQLDAMKAELTKSSGA